MTPPLRAAIPAAALCTLCLAGLTAFGLRQEKDPSKPDSIPADSLAVILGTEVNGYLTPCGCSKPMLGGLPRRATYIKGLAPQSAVITVENGDLTHALGRQDELKAETIVEALSSLRYDAINLGEKDFRLTVPYLQALQARFQGAFLSANTRKMDGSPAFAEYKVVRRDVSGRHVRAALVGLISDRFADGIRALNPDLQVEEPALALDRLEPKLTAESDVRILLYHGPKEEAVAIAERFKFLQLVVFAHDGDHPAEVKRVGQTALVSNGQDGKYIGRAILTASSGWQAGDVTFAPLAPQYKDDPDILLIKKGYLERVISEDLLGKVIKLPTPNGDAYAGSAACARCHAEPNRIWRASGHAHALQTLVEAGHDKDPECVGCHVVGLDRVSGFLSPEKTPLLKDVGCETCHGPAGRHVKDFKVKLPKAGSASCIGCHNPENSPRFEFDKYWPKIKH